MGKQERKEEKKECLDIRYKRVGTPIVQKFKTLKSVLGFVNNTKLIEHLINDKFQQLKLSSGESN